MHPGLTLLVDIWWYLPIKRSSRSPDEQNSKVQQETSVLPAVALGAGSKWYKVKWLWFTDVKSRFDDLYVIFVNYKNMSRNAYEIWG